MITVRKDFNIAHLLFIFLLFIVSPFCVFIFAILFYKRKYSYLFLILFAFYFGWFFEPQMDLLNHYLHFKTLLGKSLYESWSNIDTLNLGSEPFPVLFKFLVGKVSSSPNAFSAFACMVYASLLENSGGKNHRSRVECAT